MSRYRVTVIGFVCDTPGCEGSEEFVPFRRQGGKSAPDQAKDIGWSFPEQDGKKIERCPTCTSKAGGTS